MSSVNVLFVCLGNICRSPTAQGVFEAKLDAAGLANHVKVDSAGTSNWHIGSSPDRRTIAAAKTRGYALAHLRGRQFNADDYSQFDYILAMDNENLSDMLRLKPNDFKGHLGLFLHFASASDTDEVPDPYYGGVSGFDLVLDLCEQASDGLIARIKTDLQL